MVKNYYHRSFIILKCEETGYSILQDREPAGYCKLEIRRGKGRIQIYVQNLKPIKQQDGIYEVYLVSEDRRVEPIKLTSINVDERGRGEKAVDFNAEDINGSGYSLETFHALAVVFRGKDLSGQMKIGYPLVGYSSRNVKIDWTGQIVYYLERIHRSSMKDVNIGIETKDIDYKKNQVKKVDRNEVESLDRQTESNNKERAMEYEELDVNEDHKIIDEDEIQDIARDNTYVKQQSKEQNLDVGQQTQKENMEFTETQLDDELQRAYQDTYHEFSEDIPPHIWQEDHENGMAEESSEFKRNNENPVRSQNLKNDIKGDYWDNVKDYFTGLFKTHRLIRPFDKDMGDAEWIRVQQQPPMAYLGYYSGPYYNQTYSPYNQMYYNGTYFEHYIIGLIREQDKVKYVVYGIPSMYSMIPPTNMTGFSRWVPVKNGYGMGYWLIYIDASTGCVVYPYEKE